MVSLKLINNTNFGGIRGGSNDLGTLFGVCAYVNWLQHLLWQQICLFGNGDFVDFTFLRRFSNNLITFMPFWHLFDGISGGPN